MSQQINLLVQERSATSAVMPYLVGLAVLLALLLGYWQVARVETAKAREAAAQAEQQLLAAKATLQEMQQQLVAQQTNEDVAREIAELRARAEAGKEIMALLQKGDLGSAEGYYGYLVALARSSGDGFWLTGLNIENGGKEVSISGRALQSEAVLQYARKLNDQFSVYGVQFNSVEMTPEVFGKGGNTVAGTFSTVSFKLF